MNTRKIIASAIAAGSVFANTALPAFAATEVVITGNGAGADNFATVTQTTTTTVTQNNSAFVVNNVDADANTGDNSSKFNTGGSTAISTGNAVTDVDVVNTLNSNVADVDCCDTGDTKATISGNGAFSVNDLDLNKRNVVRVDQDNYANVANDVDSDADSGHNKASLNTGGDTVIVTGAAVTDVNVSTSANSNIAKVGNGQTAGNPSATFVIEGNGAGSLNFLTADLVKSAVLDQDNSAYVRNYVDADADSGHNDAKFNTGGDVITTTGLAKALVNVDNAVNFNSADIDCGCTWDVKAKIAGNGAGLPYHHGGDVESLANYILHPYLFSDDNVLTLGLTSAQVYGQDNYGNLLNDVRYVDADSGHNKNSLNVGSVDGMSDPLIVTGNAVNDVNVSNTGNTNVIGDTPSWTWPTWSMGDTDVEVSFNMSALMALFGLHMS